MSDLVIDTNIPAPSNIGWKSQIDALEIGESFSFDNEKRASVSYAASWHFHRLTDKRFTISADPENPKTKSRVWRIEDFNPAA